MKLSAIYTVLCFLMYAGCEALLTGDFDGNFEEGGFLQTDTTYYQAEIQSGNRDVVRLDIPFTITNAKDEPIYMLGCGRAPAPLLQKNVGGEWVTAYSPVELMCLSPPFIIEPGETFYDTLRVHGALPGQNTEPTFDTKIKGVYRLVHTFYIDPDSFDDLNTRSKNLLPESLRISNTFYVEKK